MNTNGPGREPRGSAGTMSPKDHPASNAEDENGSIAVAACAAFTLPCSAVDPSHGVCDRERIPQSSQRNQRPSLPQLPRNGTRTPLCLHLDALCYAAWLHGWRSHSAIMRTGSGGEGWETGRDKTQWEAACRQGQTLLSDLNGAGRWEQQVTSRVFFSFPASQPLVTEHDPVTKGERRAEGRSCFSSRQLLSHLTGAVKQGVVWEVAGQKQALFRGAKWQRVACL